MTYLELVNSVLRRLREDEITTVSESDYSRLIGDFVNDAKRLVEDSWDWTGLRQEESITTVAGTNTYTLTDYSTRSKIMSVHNETTNQTVVFEYLPRIRQLYLQNEGAQGPIQYYTVDGVDSNGDIQIRFHMVPNAVNTITVYAVKRTDSLTNDSDSVLIPTAPIVQWAYAYALRERGETGGQSAVEQSIFAKEDLTNAISQDAGQHPNETIWYS
jgi:hypothetical protein